MVFLCFLSLELNLQAHSHRSFLYYNENGLLGSFSEETHFLRVSDQVVWPFLPYWSGRAAAYSPTSDNRTAAAPATRATCWARASCKPGSRRVHRPLHGLRAWATDLEMKYLLKAGGWRCTPSSCHVTCALNSWFDPSVLRMLLTLKSNKYKSEPGPLILGLPLPESVWRKTAPWSPCWPSTSTLSEASHSESWFMPVNEPASPTGNGLS